VRGCAGPQRMPIVGRRSLVLRSQLLAFGSVGVSARRGPRVHEQWARFRFSVIGQLLAAPPAKGELRRELAELAAREWRHPVTGEPVRLGVSTVERWYYRARKERHDPVGVLRRKVRTDAGRQAAMGAALREAVLAQYAAHKSWSAKLHHDNLLALAERQPGLAPVPSYSTLRRFLKAHGLDKRRRLTSRRTDGAERAEARLFDREVRSYEAAYVNGLWHWDCHHGSRKVLTPRGEWQTPILFGALDDRSRLACHLQWYLAENAENIAHGLSQAFQKRGLPRAALSDNGAAMTAAEITEGLARLGIVHETTLPYSPYQNAKQESFWGPVEGRLIAMLEDVSDLTLAKLNEATQAWVEYEYNRKVHSEIGEAPIARFLKGPEVTRQSPDSAALRLAFTRTDQRTQRKSDGTVVIEGRRFELPNRYRHLTCIEVRFASWDLTTVHLVDARSGKVLCRLYPQDKTRNASGLRRPLDQVSAQPVTAKPSTGMAPLLARLIDQQAATGLPPPYLPKDEGDDA
jgi:putative transposase